MLWAKRFSSFPGDFLLAPHTHFHVFEGSFLGSSRLKPFRSVKMDHTNTNTKYLFQHMFSNTRVTKSLFPFLPLFCLLILKDIFSCLYKPLNIPFQAVFIIYLYISLLPITIAPSSIAFVLIILSFKHNGLVG